MTQPTLVDTSAWVDYLIGRSSPVAETVSTLLSEDNVLICPMVHQEILQGIRDNNEHLEVKSLLQTIPRLKFDAYAAAEGAADVYRTLRRQGITIRKSNDCLIAWYALQARIAVLHRDRDFDIMAKPLKLKVMRI
ncbi:MAG: type II toxin-antitoxin system toxin ribonuclease VapC11 [Turneriella sp.]